MSAVVIPLVHSRQTKARGVFDQISTAARRMGVGDRFAVEYAKRARDDFNRGGRSPAIVIADWTATLRAVVKEARV